MMIYEDIKKVFKKGTKLKENEDKLRKKINKLYKKFSKIAYQLHIDFLKNNLDTLNDNEVYYKMYFENNYVVVEELYFKDKNDNFITFTHKSKYRNNISVTVCIDIEEKYYESNSAVIDYNQLQNIASFSKIITRK